MITYQSIKLLKSVTPICKEAHQWKFNEDERFVLCMKHMSHLLDKRPTGLSKAIKAVDLRSYDWSSPNMILSYGNLFFIMGWDET